MSCTVREVSSTWLVETWVISCFAWALGIVLHPLCSFYFSKICFFLTSQSFYIGKVKIRLLSIFKRAMCRFLNLFLFISSLFVLCLENSCLPKSWSLSSHFGETSGVWVPPACIMSGNSPGRNLRSPWSSFYFVFFFSGMIVLWCLVFSL